MFGMKTSWSRAPTTGGEELGYRTYSEINIGGSSDGPLVPPTSKEGGN